jgi:hypothetical protein
MIVAQTDNCVLGVSTLLTPGAFGAGCSPTAGNTSSGYTDSNQGCTAGNEDDDVWYRFVATSNTHTITVDGGADFDAVLGVYSDCSGSQPSGGACVDATGTNGNETRVVTGLTIGNTYYICVHDYATGGGNFTICITTLAPVVTMTNGTSTVCNATFQDNGGTGSYSNNQNLVYTFCPSTPGQCIRSAFSSFDLEDSFDYLSVYNGNSTSAPMMLGSSFSATSPGTLTATTTNASGCMTFKFSSDGATTASGWVANITCATCAAVFPNGVQQDCNGAPTICTNQSVSGTSLGTGSYNDLNLGLGNLGCLNNYAATPDGSAEHQSNWYYFSPSASGTIGMTIAPSSSSTDYDWAIFGPYNGNIPCPPTGPPLRCSAATAANSTGGATGLGNGASDTEEGSGGNGWVSAINVVAGQKYILFLDNWNATSAPYTLSWQLSNGAALGCALLPIELISFTGSNKKDFNLIEWITNKEHHNDYYELERSTDGHNWREIAKINAIENLTQNKFYNYEDHTFTSNEINYYRLKQVDLNNEFKYSQIISIEATEGPKPYVTNLHPNPTNQKINFGLYTPIKGMVDIQILDFTGLEVLTDLQEIAVGKNDIKLDLSALKNGIYLLKIIPDGSEKPMIQKIIKQ